ncbi:hypothetical protein Tco_1349144, partial [Tanacetum coccineum]
RTIDQSASGKLHDRNAKESWALLEDLAFYNNESWNDPRNFAKPVKAISLPQDVPSTSDRHLIELENQVQCLMESHLAPKQPIKVNKITSSCEIYSGPHDTQACMENLEQTFVDYASSRTNEAGGKWYTFKPEQNNLGDTYNPSWKSHPNLSSVNAITICLERPGKLQNSEPEEEEQEEKDNPENINTDPSLPPDPSVSLSPKQFLNSIHSLNHSAWSQSSNTEFVCTKGDDGDVMFIEIIKQDDDSHIEEPKVGENAGVEES